MSEQGEFSPQSPDSQCSSVVLGEDLKQDGYALEKLVSSLPHVSQAEHLGQDPVKVGKEKPGNHLNNTTSAKTHHRFSSSSSANSSKITRKTRFPSTSSRVKPTATFSEDRELQEESEGMEFEDDDDEDTGDSSRDLDSRRGLLSISRQSNSTDDLNYPAFRAPQSRRARVKKRRKVGTIRGVFNFTGDFLKKHLRKKSTKPEDVDSQAKGNLVSPGLPKSLLAPLLIIRSDERGRQPPPILLDALHVTLKPLSNNPDSFALSLTYGDLEWTATKRLLEFVQLHLQLSLTHVKLPTLPAFLRPHVSFLIQKAKDAAMHTVENIEHRIEQLGRPRQYSLFTSQDSDDSDEEGNSDESADHEAYMRRRESKIDSLRQERCAALEKYLISVLKECSMQNGGSVELCQFFELSRASLCCGKGQKGKEGLLKLRVNRGKGCLPFLFTRWKTVWVTVNDSFLTVSGNVAAYPHIVLFNSPSVDIKTSTKALPFKTLQLTLRSKYQKIVLESDDKTMTSFLQHLDRWKNSTGNPIDNEPGSLASLLSVESGRSSVETNALLHDTDARTIDISDRGLTPDPDMSLRLNDVNPTNGTDSSWSNSFAPVRFGRVQPFVDAEEYFKTLAYALEHARKSVYIAGWWVSPEVHLLRPPRDYFDYRLDRLLQRIADRGVEIFVLLYKEVSFALPNNSTYTKGVLQNLNSSNIKVLRTPNHPPHGGVDLCFGRFDTRQHLLGDSLVPATEIWPGLDYSNPRVRDFRDVHLPHLNLIPKDSLARMPWHDVHSVVTGSPVSDICRHFVQRWNWAKYTNGLGRSDVRFLMPVSAVKAESSSFSYLFDKSFFLPTSPQQRVQVVRSISGWSGGLKRERSVYEAYMNLIESAHHFIYIENQFFITSTSDGSLAINNRIGEAIVSRIIRAHRKGQTFRVILIIPLLPAFEGEFAASNSQTVRLVMHYQYISICRGGQSLIERLENEGVTNWQDYLAIFSLRSWGQLRSNSSTSLQRQTLDSDNIIIDDLVSEMIYVHDKILIVDDRVAVIGSANINDRSLRGDRDSELAVVFEDDVSYPDRYGNTSSTTNGVVSTLRKRLMQEFLGLLDSPDSHMDALLDQALSDDLWSLLKTIARGNTEVYRHVFRSIPDDSVTTWAEYREFLTASNRRQSVSASVAINWTEDLQFATPSDSSTASSAPTPSTNQTSASTDQTSFPLGHVYPGLMKEEVIEHLRKVRGHLVEFPLKFLEKENLGGVSTLSKEFLLPAQVFL